MNVEYTEFGCEKCGSHVSLPDGSSPIKCMECGHKPMAKRVIGPLELRKQISVLGKELNCMWLDMERLDDTMKAVLDALRIAATDIVKVQMKLDNFIEAHDDRYQSNETEH